MLALFSLKAGTEFGRWYFLFISLPLFLADHDTNEGVRTRAAYRGPNSGVHHAWRITGTVPGEVHFLRALEKPDEWTDTGRGHLGEYKHLSWLSTWKEPSAEAAVQSISCLIIWCCHVRSSISWGKTAEYTSQEQDCGASVLGWNPGFALSKLLDFFLCLLPQL